MWKMKANRYFKIGFTVFLTFAACLIFYSLYSNVSPSKIIDKIISILIPFFAGFAIAYLVHPILFLMESKVFEPFLQKRRLGKYKKILRGVSVTVAMLISLAVVFGLLWLVIPQLASSLESLIKRLPNYATNILNFLDGFFQGNPELVKHINDSMQQVQNILRGWVGGFSSQLPGFMIEVVSGVTGFITFCTNLVLGIVISFYVLYHKESFIGQFKKMMAAVFPQRVCQSAVSLGREIHFVFGGFLTGMIIDSLIIGALCFIGISILQIPYAVLIAVLVGITNIIPFFGPFIGAIPAAFLILMEAPEKTIWFILFIIVLQQVDGNILKPKILGNTTGLSTFWVLFAILVGGGLFGFLGMFLGVPVFSVLYALITRWCNRRLIQKNLPTKTDFYYNQSEQKEETP